MNHQRVLRGSLAIPMRHHLTTVLLAPVGRTAFRVAVSRSVGWVAEFQMLIYRVLISLWFFNTTSVATPVEDVKSYLRYQGELLGPHIWESSLDHDSGEKK